MVNNNFQLGEEVCGVQHLPSKKRRRMCSNQEKKNMVCSNFEPRKEAHGVQ
jgi:hypothetical protein